MLGSISSERLPTDDSGTPGSAAPTPGTRHPETAHREPAGVPPLLRGRAAELVAADRFEPAAASDESTGTVETADSARREAGTSLETVIDQLAPIRSYASLASSFSREANPHDPTVRAAYACVWADLAMSVTLGTTRRARRRATMPLIRRVPVRGRG